MEPEVVYHGVLDDLRGDTLLPLNRLREAHPDLYERYIAKYRGRADGGPLRPIPPLGCANGHVLMFSPVHPADIRAALAEIGRPWVARRRWLALDAARHFTAEDTVLLLPGDDHGNPVFVPYTAGCLAAHRAVSERQKQKFRDTPPERPVLLFAGTVRVLHRGAIPLEGARVVEV